MSWFYAEGGVQKGPITEEALRALVHAGTITGATLVWQAGMSDWKPYGSLPNPPVPVPSPVAGPGPAQSDPLQPASLGGPTAVCGECGQTVAAADTVLLQGRTICANCKPRVVQRIVEGADAGRSQFNLDEFLAGLRANGGYRVEVFGSIERGWNLVKGNFWPCVGNTFLIYLAHSVAGQVPCLGLIAVLLLTGPLFGGLFAYFLLQIRGRPANVNDAFSGFRPPAFNQLMLASLVVQILPVVLMAVVMLPMIISLEFGAQRLDAVPPWIFAAIVPLVLVMTYYTLITTPCYLIIADTGLGFWDGIKLSVRLVHMRLFSFLGFSIIAWLLCLAGLLMLCVGIFVAAPVLTAACAYIWTDIVKASEDGRAAVSGAPRS